MEWLQAAVGAWRSGKRAVTRTQGETLEGVGVGMAHSHRWEARCPMAQRDLLLYKSAPSTLASHFAMSPVIFHRTTFITPSKSGQYNYPF